MAHTPVSIGTTANDGTGTPWRTAWERHESAIVSLEALQSKTINVGDERFAGEATTELRVQAAITAAAAELATIVFVPSFLVPYAASLVTFNDAIKMVWEGGAFDEFDWRAYGADSTGVLDATDAARAALLGAFVGRARCTPGGGIYTLSGQLTLKNRVQLCGFGRETTQLLASASFPADTPMVQIGETGFLAFGSRVENLALIGQGNADIGVYSDSMQEQSGIQFVLMSNFNKKALHLASKTAQAVKAQNYFVRDVETTLSATSDSSAIAAHFEGDNNSGKTEIGNITVNVAGGVSDVPGKGVQLDGISGHVRNIHTEHVLGGGVCIGEVTPCIGLTVDGVFGGVGTNDLVRIGNTQNDELTMTGIVKSDAVTTIRDNFTGLVFTDLRIGFYHTGVVNNTGSPNYPLLKQTTVSATLAAGNNNNYAIPAATNSSAPRTGTLRLTGDAGGTSVLTGIATGKAGRELWIYNVSANNVGIAHEDGNSATTNRIVIAGGAAITLGANGVAQLRYDAQTSRWRLVNWQI